MTSYDTIILGSSPHALTAAAYLARGGKRVLVLEPSDGVGSIVATEEFAPGFLGDVGLTSGRIDPAVAEDLKLADHGLEVLERNSFTSLLSDGRSFTLPKDQDAATAVINRFSGADARRYKSFLKLAALASDFLSCAYSMTPPADHPPTAADLEKLTELVSRIREYGQRQMTEVMRLLVMPVRDLLDEWFENDALKGLLGSVGVRGLNQGPFAGSTTYNLLHHLASGDGFFRATAKGGIGSIGNGLVSAAQCHGAEIRTKVGRLRVIVDDGVATGVQVGDQEAIEAAVIISDYDARYTFTQLVAPPDLEPEFNREVNHIRYNSAVARINLALNQLPEFPGLTLESLSGTLVVAPTLAYLERAFDGGKHGAVSTNPFLEVTIPSIADSSLAPAGKHVMSIWWQYAPYRSAVKPERLLELALDCLAPFAPNLKKLVQHSQIITPRDFESRFHLSEGHLYGGEMNLAQSFFLRPVPGFAQYQTPIRQLYLCGAAVHPGGGAHGLCGRNAARQVGVKDLVPA